MDTQTCLRSTSKKPKKLRKKNLFLILSGEKKPVAAFVQIF